MADATALQTSFLGGEWSPYAQGRADDKEYRAGMNTCFNGYPIETGAWVRRQGTRFCATTRFGQPAWLLPFAFKESSPYTMEFTNQYLRLFNGPDLVMTNDPQVVASVSNANPAVITTKNAHGWSSNNQVQFLFNTGASYPLAAPLMNRQFLITVLSTTTFSIADPITGNGIDGSTITYSANSAQVARVNEIASPYLLTQLTSINRVQAEGVVVTLLNSVAPYALTQVTAPSASAFATFTYGAATFTDGPYLDPVTTGTITPSGLSGSITLSGAPANTFVSTDVGRMIRLNSEPALWASGTAYTTGEFVSYGDLYYVALANSTGSEPDTNPNIWGVSLTAAVWTWGLITAVGSDTSVTFTVEGVPLLYTIPVRTWRLGLYSATTGYPTCGVYHEGRLWLAGAQGNRIDASNTNDNPFDFTPTAGDGTVGDGNAISYVFNAEDVNTIFGMAPNNGGIVCTTQGGEWVVVASTLNDPLTPTSIQAHRRSKYKGANVQPATPPLALLFVQAQGRKVMEYVADVFSGKYLGRNLNEKSRHLTTSGIAQIAYQQELNPILWARCNDGSLIGSTYKRESSFTSEAPTMNGWHRHALGSGRLVESISVGPSVNGDLESLSMVTNDPDTNVRWVEMLTDMFDETATITDAWFLDGAVTPTAAVEDSGDDTVTFYGMEYLAGDTVSVWAGGLDLGDYAVGSDGSVAVPINSATNAPLFTDAYLTSLAASGEDFGGLGVYLNRSVAVQYPVPSGLTIQSYIPTIVTTTHTDCADDYLANEVYTVETGNDTTAGISVFNRFTGAVLRGAAIPSIITAGSYTPGSNYLLLPTILGKDGFIYFNSDDSNSSVLRKVSRDTLELVGSFGIQDSSLANNNNGAAVMSSGCVMTFQGRNFLFQGSVVLNSINVIDVDRMSWAGHTLAYPEEAAVTVCAGETINNGPNSYIRVYSISCPASNTTTPIGFYSTTMTFEALEYSNPFSPFNPNNTNANSGIVTTRISQITPADVDATWSHFLAIAGLTYDQTDGNLIMFASTNDSVTNKGYVFKINSTTGAVMWATPTPSGVIPNTTYGLNRSTIKYGLFSFLLEGGSTTFCTVTTSSGALVSESVNPAVGALAAISNDIDGSVIASGTWGGTTPPTPLNSTAAFSTAQIYRLMGYSGFPGQITDTESVVMPVVIGFTYTSQGAMLRGIAPDATGARNGPALGKTRRNHRFSALFANTQGISWGCALDQTLHAAKFLSRAGRGVTPLALNQLYTGTYSDTIEADYNYDNAPAWQITRPYPANVAACMGFVHTQDR